MMQSGIDNKMADFYPYLIASLPLLQFGMKPPFTYERFLDLCHQFIPEKDLSLLRTLPRPEHYSAIVKRPGIIQRWIAFDTGLRNELARVRANRKHTEPETYLRPSGYTGPSLAPIASGLMIQPSVLEAEKTLDETRWKALDALATGHYFDREALIIYAYKLLILQRWQDIRDADAPALLMKTLSEKESA